MLAEHGQRAVAQLGSALDWGSRGREFKSRQPDRVKCLVRRQIYLSKYFCFMIVFAGDHLFRPPFSRKRVAKPGQCLTRHVRRDVAVDVTSDRDARMTEDLRDHLERHAS
jgi:hypothetical protein